MDTLWLILGLLFMLAGIAGSILPFLPGPPLSYVALLLMQLRSEAPFTSRFLLLWAVITAVVVVLDYAIPIYGTKRYGGSRYGIWGCTIGLVLGLFFGPLGIIIGPFTGAFIGEMIAHNNQGRALKAAMGSFVGFVAGILLKLVVCLVMFYYWIMAAI